MCSVLLARAYSVHIPDGQIRAHELHFEIHAVMMQETACFSGRYSTEIKEGAVSRMKRSGFVGINSVVRVQDTCLHVADFRQHIMAMVYL